MHSPCSLEISRLPEDLNVKKYRRQNIKSGMYYLENPSSIYCHITHRRQKLYSSNRLFRKLEEVENEEEERKKGKKKKE